MQQINDFSGHKKKEEGFIATAKVGKELALGGVF